MLVFFTASLLSITTLSNFYIHIGTPSPLIIISVLINQFVNNGFSAKPCDDCHMHHLGMGTWAFQAKSRALYGTSIAEKHEHQILAEYGRVYLMLWQTSYQDQIQLYGFLGLMPLFLVSFYHLCLSAFTFGTMGHFLIRVVSAWTFGPLSNSGPFVTPKVKYVIVDSSYLLRN